MNDMIVFPGVTARRLCALLLAVSFAAFSQAASEAQQVMCSDFDAFEWAQSVYESDPARYAALDPDGDGLACPELGAGAAPALWTSAVPAGAEPVQLSRVVDGDTADFVFGDGTVDRVRFLLIDTPETVDPSRPDGCFGREASDFTAWLLSLGGAIYLERDVSERDRFDRLLRYVWLDFGGGEVYLLNEALVRSGYAALSTFPPDVKYVDQVQAAQEFALRHQRGLWGACSAFGAPATEQHNPPPSQPSPPAMSRAPATPATRPFAYPPAPISIAVTFPTAASLCCRPIPTASTAMIMTVLDARAAEAPRRPDAAETRLPHPAPTPATRVELSGSRPRSA